MPSLFPGNRKIAPLGPLGRTALIDQYEVEFAVPVKIASRHCLRRCASRRGHCGVKRPVTFVDQNADVGAPKVRHCQIRLAIAVKVADYDC